MDVLLNLIAFPPPEMRRFAAFCLLALVAILCWALVTPGVGPGTQLGMDKMAHAGAFALLGAVATVAWPGRAGAVRAMLGLGLLALMTELVQSMLPFRQGAIGDGLADILGAALGIAVVYLIRRRQAARIG